MADFTNKQVLIVGGTSGIGQAIVRDLIEKNAQVIMASRQKPAPEIAEQVTHIPLDVNNIGDQLADLPDTIHGLVYMPGSINLKPFTALKPEDFLADFQLNVGGAIQVIKAALKPLKAAQGASVVLFSTVAVHVDSTIIQVWLRRKAPWKGSDDHWQPNWLPKRCGLT